MYESALDTEAEFAKAMEEQRWNDAIYINNQIKAELAVKIDRDTRTGDQVEAFCRVVLAVLIA